MRSHFMRGASPIVITAALSIAILFAVSGVELGKRFGTVPIPVVIDMPSTPVERPSYLAIEDADTNGIPDWQDELARAGIVINQAATTTETVVRDPLTSFGTEIAGSLFGGYITLKQYNQYTPERGEQLAHTVAANFYAPETFQPHTVEAIAIQNDTSEAAVLAYRSAMRDALAPIVNDGEPEFTLYANYVATKDRSWLEQLRSAAATYRSAEKNVLAVPSPKDVVPEHLRAVNSLGQYANTLERLVAFANDSLAALALIKTYNESERELFLSFDALAKYYVRKVN